MPENRTRGAMPEPGCPLDDKALDGDAGGQTLEQDRLGGERELKCRVRIVGMTEPKFCDGESCEVPAHNQWRREHDAAALGQHDLSVGANADLVECDRGPVCGSRD